MKQRMKRVAIEPNLTPIRDALQARGYQVVPLEPGRRQQADAYVVTGMQDNLMGIQDTDGARAPVVEARGLTAEQVVREVDRRAGGEAT